MISKIKQWLEKYEKYMRIGKLKINPLLWLSFGLILALAVGFFSYMFIQNNLPQVSTFMAIVIGFVILDLFWAYPYFRALRVIDSIERTFPTVLREMSDILKAGGTYDSALREIKNNDYGPISAYFASIVRKLDEGGTLENSLYSFAQEMDSKIIKRTITIIVDAIKAGARLSRILDEIADDARAIYKLGEERKSQTMLQTAFILAAGVLVAPGIFGLVGTIITVLLKSSINLVSSQYMVEQAITNRKLILDLFVLYIFISNLAASIMISLMREGSIKKSFLYTPIILLISYTIYYIVAIISAKFLGVSL